MKQALIILMLASPCFAGPSVTLLGGGTFPMSKIEIEGGGKDDIGKSGVAAGIQLMVPVHERISVGFDFLNHNFGEKTSDVLLPPTRATYQLDSRTFLAAGRLDFPHEKIRPFIFLGLGFHSSSMEADLEPTAGLAWSDTGTTEKRRIIDDSGTAFASALALGADFSVSSAAYIGFEARYSYFGKTTFHTRSISATSSTVGEIEGDTSSIDLLARLSFRF